MNRRISNIIKAANLSPTLGASVSSAAGVPPAKTAHAPQDTATINLHRNGDLIEAIEVTCSCGRTTFIECVYEDQEPTS